MSHRHRLAAGLVAAALTATAAACGGGSAKPKTSPTTSASDCTAASPTTYKSPPATLPAVPVPESTQPPPWVDPLQGNLALTPQYVEAAGLPYAAEMLSVHYHAHLDININGAKAVVPPYIGFVAKCDKLVGLAPLHTHATDGIIHIENSVPATFVLGQFFVEWGVRFSPTCLGPYCTGQGKELAVFVDGKRYTGDPTRIVLKAHQEIAIEYGATGKVPTPPSSYPFPAGL